MRNIRKIILCVLVLSMLISNWTFVASSVDIESAGYSEAVETLTALGILDFDAQKTYNPDEYITRREFAMIICRFAGFQNEFEIGVKGSFSDVPSDDIGAASIETVFKMGVINGYGNGKFDPDDPIAYEQAVKIIVSILGYDLQAQAKGGYPSGYITLATEKRIISSVKGKVGESITYEVAANLIYNAIDVNIMEQDVFGNVNQYSTTRGNTILSVNLDIEKIEGVITDNSNTSLNGETSILDDEIKIKDSVYKTGKTNAKDYLGYNVTCYVKKGTFENDNSTILYVRVNKQKNSLVNVNSNDVSDSTNLNYFEYWKDGNKNNKTTRLALSPIVSLIYNGRAIPLKDVSDLKPDEGNVTFVDNDNDSKYDVIIVNSYETYFVDSIAISSYKIYDKLEKNKSVILDQSDADKKITIVKKDKSIDLNGIKQNNILSIAKSKDTLSGKQIINVIVSDAKANGFVIEVSNDDKSKDIKIWLDDDSSYKVSSQYKNTISVLDEGQFYLDFQGEICGVDLGNTVRTGELVLLSGITKGQSLGDYKIKVLNKDNEWLIYELAPKVFYTDGGVNDGKLSEDKIYSLFKENDVNEFQPQVISIVLNDHGEVSKINVAEDITSATDIYSERESKRANDQLTKETYNTNYYYGGYMFGAEIIIGQNTILISESSSDETNLSDEDMYTVINRNSLSESDNGYTFTAYNVDEYGVAGAVTVQGNTTMNLEGSFSVISRIVKAQRDDTTVTRIYGYEAGNEITLDISEKCRFKYWGSNPDGIKTINYSDISDELKLVPGDVVYYTKDSKGLVDQIQRAGYDGEHTNVDTFFQFKRDLNKPGIYGDVYQTGNWNLLDHAYIYGTVESFNQKEKIINVKTSIDGISKIVRVPLNIYGYSMYEFNCSNNVTTKLTESDISKGQLILVRMLWLRACDIVIYKNPEAIK